MGVEDYLLSATLSGLLAQRLVRRLCPDCARPTRASAEMIDRFDLAAAAGSSEITFFEAVGCPTCLGTGYRGRLAIGEFLRPDDQFHQRTLRGSDQAALQEAAVAAGMRPLFVNGIREAVAGRTTIQEVMRSVREGN
jgi:general secretion pathway protein E